jgi:hypothetical protein
MKQPSDKEIRKGIDAFIRRMLDLTVHLVRIEGGRPASAGSGFIYERDGRHTLFSVLHSFQPDKNDPNDIRFDGWHLETGLVVDNHSLLLTLPPIEFVTELTIGVGGKVDARDVDFVWGHLDVAELREKAPAEARLKGKHLTLPVYRGRIDHEPDAIHGYGFASFSKTTLVLGRNAMLVRDPVYEVAMTFDGYDARGLCRFKLDGEHKGDVTYHGSSGSPIADDEKNIVALVQGGDQATGIIFGVPLHRYARVIDIPSHRAFK